MAFFSTTTPKYLPWLFLSNYSCTLCSSWSHPASVWIAVLSVKVMIKLLTPVTAISSLLYLVSEFTIKFIRAEIYLYLSSRVHCLHKNFHFSAKHFDFGICSVDKKISIFWTTCHRGCHYAPSQPCMPAVRSQANIEIRAVRLLFLILGFVTEESC